MALKLRIRRAALATALSISPFAGFNTFFLASCNQTSAVAQQECRFTSLSRDAVLHAFENAKSPNGRPLDLKKDMKEIIGDAFKLVIDQPDKKIHVYKEGRKIDEFNITDSIEDVTISLISGKLLLIADKNKVAVYQEGRSLVYDCSQTPFISKPRFGIRMIETAQGVVGYVEAIVVSSLPLYNRTVRGILVLPRQTLEGLDLKLAAPEPLPTKLKPFDITTHID